MVACPFQIPTYEYQVAYMPHVRKCDWCYERVSGEGQLPACVAACPTEAITFGKRQDLLEAAREMLGNPRKASAGRGPYVDHIFGEYEAGGTRWLYISPVPFTELEFPQNLGGRSYPSYTRMAEKVTPALVLGLGAVLTWAMWFSRRRRAVEKLKQEDVGPTV